MSPQQIHKKSFSLVGSGVVMLAIFFAVLVPSIASAAFTSLSECRAAYNSADPTHVSMCTGTGWQSAPAPGSAPTPPPAPTPVPAENSVPAPSVATGSNPNPVIGALPVNGTTACFTYYDTAIKVQKASCYPDMNTCTSNYAGAPAGYWTRGTPCVANQTEAGVAAIRSGAATTPGEERAAKRLTEKELAEKGGRGFLPDALYFLLKWTGILPILTGIAYIIFKVAGIFLVLMANIMDWSISISIDSQLLGSTNFVNIGWTAVRDFANMFFIFALLYIAIQTILGLAGGNAKRVLVHIIIAALLINFSLFATKVVIDAGNILAVSLWDKVRTQQGPGVVQSGASATILGGLDLQTVFKSSNVYDSNRFDSLIVIYAGGAVFMFIAGYIFLAAALMMVTRTIMLLLLMVFSPFAFMALGLPKLEQYGHKWLDKLIKQTFVAPFFIFMLYLNVVIVKNMDIFNMSGSKGQSFANALVGQGDYQIIFNFILMIGFLVASLAIANSFAGDVGSHARGWAKSATKWAGGMAVAGTVAGTAFGLRQGLGKVGMMGKDNATLHAMATEKGWRGMVGRGGIALSSGMARATYDIRGTKLGGKIVSGGGRIDVGQAGGKGGRLATGSILGSTPVLDLLNKGDVGTERMKEVQELAEQRYKNDPTGKAAYLEANLGTMTKEVDGKQVRVNRYHNDPELKAMREAVATETRTKSAKDAVKEQPAVIKDAEAELADYKNRQARGEVIDPKRILDAENKLTDAVKALSGSLKQLNGKEFGDMINEKMLTDNPELLRYMTRQQAAYVNANSDKYTPKMMELMNEGVMKEGSEESRQYLIQQAKLKTSMFPTDLKEELKKELDAHQREADTYDETTADATAREKHFDTMEKLDARTQDILGAMTFKEVARLAPNEIKSNEALVRNYTEKHFNEIENYHKNIKQDAENDDIKKFFADIRRNAVEHGTKATRDYMNKVMTKKDSAYYDPTARRQGGNKDEKNAPASEEDEDEYGNPIT